MSSRRHASKNCSPAEHAYCSDRHRNDFYQLVIRSTAVPAFDARVLLRPYVVDLAAGSRSRLSAHDLNGCPLRISPLPSFSWGLLWANSCARRLRGFCFHGSSRTSRAPPIKQPLALGADVLALGRLKKMRQKEKFHVPQYSHYRRFRWNRSRAASGAQQGHEVCRVVSCYRAVEEERTRRVGVEISRLNPPLCSARKLS